MAKLKRLQDVVEIPNRKDRKRKGRGDTTAGRGTKGQKARTGKGFKQTFGEYRFYLHLPLKRGFSNTANKLKVNSSTVRLDQIAKLPADVVVNTDNLVAYGVIKKNTVPKIVCSGSYDNKKRDMSKYDGQVSEGAKKVLGLK